MTMPVSAQLTQCVNGKAPDDFVSLARAVSRCATSEERGRKRARRQRVEPWCREGELNPQDPKVGGF
jgi:hypothetical protein